VGSVLRKLEKQYNSFFAGYEVPNFPKFTQMLCVKYPPFH
jgi:hypothetical protein